MEGLRAQVGRLEVTHAALPVPAVVGQGGRRGLLIQVLRWLTAGK